MDAVSPVAAEFFHPDGELRCRKGTPLRYARQPLRSFLLQPSFLYGPAAFFQEAAQGDGPLLCAALRGGWPIFTLHRPVIRMAAPQPAWADRIPPEDFDLLREKTGLDPLAGALSPQLRTGIATPELTFPTAVPFPVRWQQSLRGARKLKDPVEPLCVTAFLKECAPTGESLGEQQQRFLHLAAVRHFPILCFADGDSARWILPRMPNVLEYKRRYGLPLEGGYKAGEAEAYLRLSAPWLLNQAREKYLNHSHYVWFDFDYLAYPVYAGAMLDWDLLCRDEIVLGSVDGVPDASMVVVPQRRLNDLCREAGQLINSRLAKADALPSPEELWAGLREKHPDWFFLPELPGKRALFNLLVLGRGEEFHTEA